MARPDPRLLALLRCLDEAKVPEPPRLSRDRLDDVSWRVGWLLGRRWLAEADEAARGREVARG